MSERRQHPRIPVLVHATIDRQRENNKHEEWRGSVTDVSLGGMAVASRRTPKIGDILTVVVVHEDGPIILESQTQWVRRMSVGVIGELRYEFGVRILKKDDHYVRFVNAMMRNFSDRRLFFRFRDSLSVSFLTRRELVRDKTVNLSKEGLFVCSTHPPHKGDKVDMKLTLPDAEEGLRLSAQVLHVVPVEHFSLHLQIPGFGVRFTDFTDNGQERLNDYLANALEHYPFAKG